METVGLSIYRSLGPVLPKMLPDHLDSASSFLPLEQAHFRFGVEL